MSTKKLVVDDAYGKLQRKKFFVLHLAPPAGFLVGDVKDVYFKIEQPDEAILVKLTGYERMAFYEIPEAYCWADRGCCLQEWKQYFKTKHPYVNNNTAMALYVYERV